MASQLDRVVIATGMPRSGTSWLGQIIDACPAVAYRVSPLFSYAFKNQLDVGSTREEWVRVLEGSWRADDNEYMTQSGKRASGEYPLFAEKETPGSTLVLKFDRFQDLVPRALELFPSLKVVAIVRHPAGALHSWLTAPKEFPPGADPREHWRTGAIKKRWPGDHFGFDDWIATTRMFRSLAERHPARVLVVRYEQLVSHALEQTRRIYSFADLSFGPQTERFVTESQSVHVGTEYSVFKRPEVKDRWRTELDPWFQEAILRELGGTDLAEYLS
jgi:hypothetical protein